MCLTVFVYIIYLDNVKSSYIYNFEQTGICFNVYMVTFSCLLLIFSHVSMPTKALHVYLNAKFCTIELTCVSA